MVTQEAVNRWCETGYKLGRTPNLADTLWRFGLELQERKTTEAHLAELYNNWFYGVAPVEVLPVVLEEIL